MATVAELEWVKIGSRGAKTGRLLRYSGYTQGVLKVLRAMLRLCLGSVQVKAAVAHTKTEPAKEKINPESRGILSSPVLL